MITQQYNLNLIPDKVPVQVNCSQFDSLSRTIEMTIYDGTVMFDIPSGTTASVRGTKADNTGFEYPCTISGSVVSFDIQPQMTVFSGRVSCELRLINNGILGTCNFNLYVEPTPLDPNVTISETDLPLLEEAEQNAIRAELAAGESETQADRAEREADRAERAVVNAVKSVNNVLPDANGNVDIDSLPSGGTQGQVLTKVSSADGDADWQNVDALPSGGSAGQALIKQSSTDGDAGWETINQVPSGGTSGQYLQKNSSGYGWNSITFPTVDQTYSSTSTHAQSGTAVASAVSAAVNEMKCLVIVSSSFGTLPQTISNSKITSDHVVVNYVLSNINAQISDWTITTSNGSLTISGSISGSTTLTLYLMKQ